MYLFIEILVKFTYLVGMIADQTFMTYVLLFYPTSLAMAYSQRPKGENCAYGPTPLTLYLIHPVLVILK